MKFEEGHKDRITSIILKDQNRFATSSYDGLIYIWKLNESRPEFEYAKAHKSI
jgi:hypothetical protein